MVRVLQLLGRRAANLRIGTKIVGAAIAGAMIFGAWGALGQVRLRGLATEQDQIYRVDVHALDRMTNVRSSIGGQQEAVLSFVLSNAGPYRDAYADAISDADKVIDDGLTALTSIELSAAERSGLLAVRSDITLWRKSRDVALDAARAGDDPQGVVYTIARLDTVARVAKQSADALVALLVDGIATSAERASVASGRTAQLMLLLGLVSVFAALALSILVARSLSRPLAEVVDVLIRAANGDLSRKVTFRRKDEIGRMGEALNDTLSILQQTFDDVHHRATHDVLTGLTNRSLLRERLEQAHRKRLAGQSSAVVLLDLDNFKQVNDLRGHAAGDHVLVITAQRMLEVVSPTDTVARLGGDEFAILLSTMGSAEDMQRFVDALVAAVERPTEFDGRTLSPKASIGAALWQAGQTIETVMHSADTELYTIKAKRKGHAVPQQRGRSAVLAAALPDGLVNSEFEVLYQPLIDLKTRRPVGVEALIRWRHPHLGTISPVEFIPIAEATGIINEIGLWVLEQSCRQVRQWQVQNPDQADLYASVNLSPLQLQSPSLVRDVFDVLTRTGLAAVHLTLEITESAVVDEEAATFTLLALRAYGIRIAIDDFGTGYSSLRYLTSLPIDIVKIDRSLTAELDGTPEHAILIESVLRLGQSLNFTLVVEGVESAEQADELEALGCHVGQGYLWAKPLSAEAAGLALSSATTTVVS